MAKKKTDIVLKQPEMTAGMQKSEYCRATIRLNWDALNGEHKEEARGVMVTHMVEKCALTRPLARVYVKENIERVRKALAAQAE